MTTFVAATDVGNSGSGVNGDGLSYQVLTLPSGTTEGDVVFLYPQQDPAALWALRKGDTHLASGVASTYEDWVQLDTAFYLTVPASYGTTLTIYVNDNSTTWNTFALTYRGGTVSADAHLDYEGGGFYDVSTSPKTLTIAADATPGGTFTSVYVARAQLQGGVAFSGSNSTAWGANVTSRLPDFVNGGRYSTSAVSVDIADDIDATEEEVDCTFTFSVTGGFHGANLIVERFVLLDGAPVQGPGALDIPETKLNLKHLPNKVLASSLDGWK